jgi:hypothetical protein
MGVKLTRVKHVTAGILATVLAGGLTVSTMQQPAAAAKKEQSPAVSSAVAAKPGSFRVASFNVLGASHTPAGGKRASGATRIVWANQLLTRHRVDVAGFQELQSAQATKFLAINQGKWALYPGLKLRKLDSENSVGWRTDKFTLLDATTVNIPYFDGHPRPMPVVLLRDKATGMMTYFANFHNPAETGQYRNQGKYRLAATNIEIALQNQLVRSGIPRIMTGDMNERADYFCRVTAGAKLKAARPTSVRKDGVCYAGRPRAVDWILGSRWAKYTNYVEDRGPLVDKTTDHPVIVSTVTVDPRRLPAGWGARPAPFVARVHS